MKLTDCLQNVQSLVRCRVADSATEARASRLGKLMALEVTPTSAGMRVGAPHVLFDFRAGRTGYPYAASKDGKRVSDHIIRSGNTRADFGCYQLDDNEEKVRLFWLTLARAISETILDSFSAAPYVSFARAR